MQFPFLRNAPYGKIEAGVTLKIIFSFSKTMAGIGQAQSDEKEEQG